MQRLKKLIDTINRLKDAWLESRIKAYATDVKTRYPNRLSLLEKIMSPIIVSKITGTVANLISIIRLLLAVIIMLIILVSHYQSEYEVPLTITALVIFIIAGFLDLLDGPCARALQEVSELGKSLDPLADKMLLAGPFILIGAFYLPPLTYVSILFLESFLIIIAIIKNLLKHMPFTMTTEANMFGKVKNIVELVGGGALFLAPFSITMKTGSNILFLMAIPLAIGSLIGYLTSLRRIR